VAHEYLRGLGIKWEEFKHKLYVVPPGELCSWGGMGYVGCTKDCRVWVSGDLWQVRNSLQVPHGQCCESTASRTKWLPRYWLHTGA
jgi:hypothetical protein